MRSLRAVVAGLVSALGAPRILIWVWIANLLVAVPTAVWIGESIRQSVRHRLAADDLARGFDFGWLGEYHEGMSGVEKTFQPTLLGVGAFLENLNKWLGLELFQLPPALVSLGLVYALLWLLLLGGVLEQYARPPAVTGLDRFLANGARHFFPFLRLAVLSAPLYWGIHRASRALFPWIEYQTRDVTREWSVLAAYLAGAAGIAFLAFLVKLIFDYAKVVLVTEQRRSALLALGKGASFVLFHPGRCVGAVLWIGLLSAAGLFAYRAIAPGAGVDDAAGVLAAFIVTQAFLGVRWVLRLAWIGAEVALYRESGGQLPPSL